MLAGAFIVTEVYVIGSMLTTPSLNIRDGILTLPLLKALEVIGGNVFMSDYVLK